MARLLLRGGRLEETLPAVSERLARAFALPSASIVAPAASPGTFPLREGARQIGTLIVDGPEPCCGASRCGSCPSLEALLAAALERDALMADAVETAALRRSDVIKTALLRSVSHDLRSPLTAIMASAEALGIDPAQREELAAAILEEGTRLSRLIDNLLDLSRLEAQAAEPRPEWSSVEEVIARGDRGRPGGRRSSSSVDGDLPPVRADAAQLERAFANLLENAHRHSGGHPVSVRARDVGGRILRARRGPRPGHPEGPAGADLRAVLPLRHRRHGPPRLRPGLAIVRGFVEANGGRVWVESLPDQATSFVVELPGHAAEAVADTRVGVDEARADLAAQVGHVHPQHLHVVGVLRAPDLDQDRPVGQQAPAIDREHAQQVELDRGEMDPAPST